MAKATDEGGISHGQHDAGFSERGRSNDHCSPGQDLHLPGGIHHHLPNHDAFVLCSNGWLRSAEAYRWTGKYYSPRSDPARGAIIGPKPSAQMLARFFANLSPLHLAADQRRAKEARERCGKPGRRKDDTLTSVERPSSRTRQRPTEPLMTFGELTDVTKPYHDLDLLTR
jgi:hypothetical protein